MSYRARILCIDDEPGMIELVALVLKPQNVQVSGANSGAEGLERLRQNLDERPDAVLLDIMMPGMDGWEVYRQIRNDDDLKQIPVIIVTARDSSFEEIIARTRANVDDYITKPFVPNKLRESIAKVLHWDS